MDGEGEASISPVAYNGAEHIKRDGWGFNLGAGASNEY